MKTQMTAPLLCAPHGMEAFKPFFVEVFGYKYEDQPFYAKLRHQLVKILLDNKTVPCSNLEFQVSIAANNPLPSI